MGVAISHQSENVGERVAREHARKDETNIDKPCSEVYVLRADEHRAKKESWMFLADGSRLSLREMHNMGNMGRAEGERGKVPPNVLEVSSKSRELFDRSEGFPPSPSSALSSKYIT